MAKQAFWVTFYSYKGGVGRSTALANVAALLAESGRRVLIIDFDLEAPGLDSFEEFKMPPGSPGMVEYTAEYLRSKRAPPVAEYIHEISLPDRINGKLWLLPAGRKDASYNRQRSSINWSDLYQNQDGALFFENFKADIDEHFQPDYVLVDSRTGLTDVGGICTAHLPSLVVLLFALNEQNLLGIASVAKVLERSESPPQLLPVATPVPNLPRDKKSPIDERFRRAKELLGIEPSLTISYAPHIALRERVYALGDSDGRSILNYQYGQLRDKISEANPGGLDYLIRQAKEAINEFDGERAEAVRRELTSIYSDRSDAWQTIAELNKLLGDPEGYESGLEKALEVDPNNLEAFNKLYGFLKNKRRLTEIIDLVLSLLEHEECLTPQSHNHYLHILGSTYMQDKKPEMAVSPFRRYFEAVDTRNSDAPQRLVAQFNLCEAQRRAGTNLDIGWRRVIETYEATLGASMASTSGGLVIRINRQQAIHIAYALLGKKDKALKLLQEVEKLVRQTPALERIFSVVDYDEINRETFLAQNQMMLEALQLDQLWDGTPLT